MSGISPLVSIVTPSLNQGAYIEETIRSVQQQTYSKFEHIIVDGGSTDNTLEVISRYQGTYNMRWVSERDHGMYEAINKGLRMANGEIIAYLNSDDLYFPWTLETAVRTLLTHPKADFVYGDLLSIDPCEASESIQFYPPYQHGYICRTGFLAQPTVFWRRCITEEIGLFDESLRFVADCDYWMRAGDKYTFAKVNEVLAVERNHPDAKRFAHTQRLLEELVSVRSSHATNRKMVRDVLGLFDRLYGFLWRRVYMAEFLMTNFRGTGQRSADWSNFLGVDGLQIFPFRILAMFLPFLGQRFARNTVRGSFGTSYHTDDLMGALGSKQRKGV